MLGSTIAQSELENPVGWIRGRLEDVRETGAALDAGEEGGDEDCVEGEVG